MFPKDVACSMTVSALSCYDENGKNESIDSLAKIDWIFHIVSYGFSLPILFLSSIDTAISICDYWIKTPNVFPSLETKNVYMRKLFRNIVCIFDFSNDFGNNHHRIGLIDRFLNNLEEYTDNSVEFEFKTWDTLIRMLIGVSDFYSEQECSMAESMKLMLLQKLYESIFNLLSKSRVQEQNLLDLLVLYSIKWSRRTTYIKSWSKAMVSEYSKVLYSISSNRDDKSLNNELFYLRFLMSTIDTQFIFENANFYYELIECVRNLYKTSVKHLNLKHSLYSPQFLADFFFGLFSKWIFDPIMKYKLNINFSFVLRIILKISSKFSFGTSGKWLEVIVSCVKLYMRDQNKSLIPLLYCFHLYKNLYSKKITDSIIKLCTNDSLKEFVSTKDWRRLCVLLYNISAYQSVPSPVFESLFDISTDIKSTIGIYQLLIFNNTDVFLVNSIKQFALVSKKYSKYLIQLLLNINILIGSSLPFLPNINISSFLIESIRIAKEYSYEVSYLKSFFIFILMVYYWKKASLTSEILIELLDFVSMIKKSNVYDIINIDSIISIMSSEPIISSADYKKKTIKNFYINERIISIIEEDSDSNTFLIRSLVGYHQWQVYKDNNTKSQEDKGIIMCTQKRPLVLDFFANIGKSVIYLEKIDELIDSFDKIPNIPAIDVPIYCFSEQDGNNARFFTSFMDSLSKFSNHQSGDSISYNFGLLVIMFKHPLPSKQLISIIFSESNMELNCNHENIPKSKLLFIIQPLRDNKYLLKCVSEQDFCFCLKKSRIFQIDHLLKFIISTIFVFVSTTKYELLFSSIKQRMALFDEYDKQKI